MVVDLYSIPDYSQRLTARNYYNAGYVKVVGGFRSRPASSEGAKVIINVNRIIGSEKGNRNYVALRTGGWESNTNLIMEVGPNAVITGAGGDGARSWNTPGQGSSGLGIEYPTRIRNRGRIQAGGGGGGGGGSAQGLGGCSRTQQGCEQCSRPGVSGGGGGGGNGYPIGNGPSGDNIGSLYSGGSGSNGDNVYGNECSRCKKYATGGRGGDGGSSGSGSYGQFGSSCYAIGVHYPNRGDGGHAIIYSPDQGGAQVGSQLDNRGGAVYGDSVTEVFY
jgi:hypothetical protein